jgi:[ribosomal protein S5]-alanine N-acetyltransferase
VVSQGDAPRRRYEASYDPRVRRANAVLRAILPPILASAARRVRRRLRLLGTEPPFYGQPLGDGVVELRPIDERDLDMIERAAQDSEICRRFALLKAKPNEYFMRLREASYVGSGAAFAISDVGGACLGLVTVERRDAGRAELGYWLLPEGRGRGRATRALRLVSRWALSYPGIVRLELSTSPENAASQRVAERSGFRREGVLRSYHLVDGRREDAVFFSLLPGDLDERAARVRPLGAVSGKGAGEPLGHGH